MRPARLIPGAILALSLAGPAPADEPAATPTGADRLIGTWTWSWKDRDNNTHRHVLTVVGSEGKVTARERFDDEVPVKVNDLKVKDDRVTFFILRGDRRAAYTGKFADADTINGDVRVTGPGNEDQEYGWTAKRSDDEAKKAAEEEPPPPEDPDPR